MNRAFSLVELSIVLVILGLLTGGILTGQNLIRAAELRGVLAEFSNYKTAFMTFRNKYYTIPGDMRNAEDFWGSMTNCGVASPSGTGTQTCNGDGDGDIDEASAADRTGEQYGFWQHLANAGLIEGTYTGIAGSGGPADVTLGTNIPNSRIANSGWHIAGIWTSSGDINFFDYTYSNSMSFGRKSATTGNNEPTLTPEEAWNVDIKVDDGRPGYGFLVTARRSLCTNSTSATDYDADYLLSSNNILCALYFRDQF